MWVPSMIPPRDACVDIVSQAHLPQWCQVHCITCRVDPRAKYYTTKSFEDPRWVACVSMSRPVTTRVVTTRISPHEKDPLGSGTGVVLLFTLQRRQRQNFSAHPGDTDAHSHLHQHRPLPCTKACSTEGQQAVNQDSKSDLAFHGCCISCSCWAAVPWLTIREVVMTLPVPYNVQPRDAHHHLRPLAIRKFPSDPAASDGEYVRAPYLTSRFLLHLGRAHLILHRDLISKQNQIWEHALRLFNSITSDFCLRLANQPEELPTVASLPATTFLLASNLHC